MTCAAAFWMVKIIIIKQQIQQQESEALMAVTGWQNKNLGTGAPQKQAASGGFNIPPYIHKPKCQKSSVRRPLKSNSWVDNPFKEECLEISECSQCRTGRGKKKKKKKHTLSIANKPQFEQQGCNIKNCRIQKCIYNIQKLLFFSTFSAIFVKGEEKPSNLLFSINFASVKEAESEK